MRKMVLLAMGGLFLIGAAYAPQGGLILSRLTVVCGPQTGDPPAGAVSFFSECVSGDFIGTSSDGELYVMTHPITMRASVHHMCTHGVGFIPDGWNGSEVFTDVESYIRISLDHGGLIKHFRIAVAENTLNAPASVRIRLNGADVIDTLTNQPVAITIPAGYLGSQDLNCCRQGRININVNRGDQVYWLIDTANSTGCISFYSTLSL